MSNGVHANESHVYLKHTNFSELLVYEYNSGLKVIDFQKIRFLEMAQLSMKNSKFRKFLFTYLEKKVYFNNNLNILALSTSGKGFNENTHLFCDLHTSNYYF